MASTLISLICSDYVYANSLVNVTVDDAAIDDSGAPVIAYSPIDAWKVGNGCSMCSAHPSPAEALDGTWHDVTWWNNGTETEAPRTASLRFEGTCHSFRFEPVYPDIIHFIIGSAVYVYCIISRFPTVQTDLTFSLMVGTRERIRGLPTGTKALTIMF